MVYQDIVEWLKEKNFGSRENAERYIRNHQQGIIFSQQIDALDYYYIEEKEQPFQEAKVLTPLQSLQQQKAIQEVKAQPAVTPNEVQVKAIKENRIRRLFRRLFG